MKEELELRRTLMLSHTFNNFEIQIYYQNEPKFNDDYFRKSLPYNKLEDGAYVILMSIDE